MYNKKHHSLFRFDEITYMHLHIEIQYNLNSPTTHGKEYIQSFDFWNQRKFHQKYISHHNVLAFSN